MALAVDRLPTDPERLRAIIVEQAAALATKEAELHVRDLLVEKLKTQLAVTAMPDSTNSPDRPSIEDGRLECPLHCSLIREEAVGRSEEHTSELQSLMRISYAVFCLTQNTTTHNMTTRPADQDNTEQPT